MKTSLQLKILWKPLVALVMIALLLLAYLVLHV